jgi:hypothetical protein
MGLGHSPRIVTDGLVLCLDAANARSYPGTGTTWTDRSASGNHGTLTNGPTFDSDNGGGIVFDGADDRISIGSSFFNQKIVDSLSVVCFARCTNMGRYQVIGGGQDTTFIRYTASLNAGAFPNRFGFDLETVSTGQARLSSNIYASNEWHHLVGTYDGSSTKLFVDGNLEDSTSSYSGNVQDFDEVRLGDDITWSGRAYQGKLTSFLMYNRALTSEEVRQNFEATKGRYE